MQIEPAEHYGEGFDWHKYLIPNPITYEGRKVVANDFSLIPKRHCRKCKNKIESWQGTFYALEIYGGDAIWPYSMSNGFCKKCALEEAQRERGYHPGLYGTPTESTDEAGRTIYRYPDGTIVIEGYYHTENGFESLVINP